ncbi:4027_t:CDS:2 [Funneliformis caledonium]|uniref:4027_t:CDS:1 n=1 Tax=Funneliformis caledonium TaxID=1117310 RepID=A0A9N9FP62_9GLOM|nr:4027_t:CDS:2 [Funneliformis caledonium]
MLVFGLTKRLSTDSSCISNALRTGRIVRYMTQDIHEKIFFNRKWELDKFNNAFSSYPELRVVLGPPSTGKTTLIREVVTNKDNFKPLFLDCRSGQFDFSKNLYDSISMQFKPFFKKRIKSLKNIMPEDLKAKLPFFKLNFKIFDKSEITPSSVSELLVEITRAFLKWNIWHSNYASPHILVVDEANLLSQLGDSSKEGAILLKTFLNWLVLNTKQENRFHAVLTSSDSFFLNWITNLLHIPHIIPYVVGDLNKEDAEEYFEKHVLPQYGVFTEPSIYTYCSSHDGTRMLIIDRYVKEYKNNEGKLTDRKFSVFELEYDKLCSGLVPVRSSGKPCKPL